MTEQARAASVLALALLRLDGVGRVAAGRLVERFGSAERLLQTPREQVLVRLPGVPRAAQLVERLLDPSFAEDLAAAAAELDRLASRQVAVLTVHHPDWPSGLRDLERAQRPVVLYAYGATRALQRLMVAFLAHPPLEAPAFEGAQAVIRALLRTDVCPVVGLQHGFDVVACKLAAGEGRPAVGVAASGLGRIPPSVRPAAAAMVRAGGLMLSSFPLEHGPFDHDDVERARLCAALADAVVMVGAPEGAAVWRAASWAQGQRPLYSTLEAPPKGMQSLSEGATLLQRLGRAGREE